MSYQIKSVGPATKANITIPVKDSPLVLAAIYAYATDLTEKGLDDFSAEMMDIAAAIKSQRDA